MWSKRNKIWLKYDQNIIAVDVYAAVFLSSYLKHASLQKLHNFHMEVIDLQRYKLIKEPIKVSRAFRERVHLPFVFVVGKN